MAKKHIMFVNVLNAGPMAYNRPAREFRFVDPATMRTEFIIVSDDCGEGTFRVRDKRDAIGIKWSYLHEFGPKVRQFYQDAMYKRLYVVPRELIFEDDERYKLDLVGVSSCREEYPVFLRGCDLDKDALVFDIRAGR